MTVTRVDTNIAGAGNSAAPAGPTTSAPTAADNTGSANIKLATGWSAGPTHAKKARGTVSARLSSTLPDGAKKAIDEAFEQLKIAQFSLSRATDNYNANRNTPESRERDTKRSATPHRRRSTRRGRT